MQQDFLLYLWISVITYLVDMHYVRHTFIHSMNFHIFYFSFLCINHFFCLFLFRCEQNYMFLITSSVTWGSSLHWSTWSQLIQTGFSFSTSGSIFSQRLYFPVDLRCALIIFPIFHSSLPFILYSTTLPLLSFFTAVFQFILIDMKTYYAVLHLLLPLRLHLSHF